MRDRLIELIKEARLKESYATSDGEFVTIINRRIVDINEVSVLADYLLENGVIVPPCKVGTTIYMIVEKRASITREYYRFIKKTKLTFLNLERVLKDFGKTVFLTKEEAEQALKGR